MSEHLQHINELQPIAARMRERQEQINAVRRGVLAQMATLIALGAEQGRDCLLSKTKLGKALKWSEWLHAHIPNLHADDAAKYQRITEEQLEDPRQCFFAFFDSVPRRAIAQEKQRAKPAVWEMAWGWVSKLKRTVTADKLGKWPEEQVELTRQELEPTARALWPERFE